MLSEPSAGCPGPHVDIIRYDILLEYLMRELECATGAEARLCGEPLIECLVKHRELISGPNVWSPRVRAYVPFERRAHGQFAVLRPAGPTTIRFLGKLLPVYCRLCFLCERHEKAEASARALLARVTASRDPRGEVAAFERRALEYLIDNLSATPPAALGELCQSTDVAAEVKIAAELLWSHLVLVYAGNRKLLLRNLERFLSTPQDSLNLCPSELRRALFAHGKHDPFSQRQERSRRERVSRAAKCPVSSLDPYPGSKGGATTSRASGLARARRLYESRVSRLSWLGALWILDVECNKDALRWLYKPVPHA